MILPCVNNFANFCAVRVLTFFATSVLAMSLTSEHSVFNGARWSLVVNAANAVFLMHSATLQLIRRVVSG